MSRRKFLATFKRKKEKGISQSKKGVLIVEERKHPRISVELPFDYSRAGVEETYGGILSNTSEGGILVYLGEAIEIGALLKIGMLFVKGFQLNAIQGIAKVVWSDLAARGIWGEYRYGLQFQSFHEGDLHKLKILLKELGKTHNLKGEAEEFSPRVIKGSKK